jgi:hypothetical protein
LKKKSINKGEIEKNTEIKTKKIKFEIPITTRTIMYFIRIRERNERGKKKGLSALNNQHIWTPLATLNGRGDDKE